MNTSPLKIISHHRHQLAEGPFWCVRSQALYWVDILLCKVWRWSESADRFNCWTFDKTVSAVFTTDSNSLVVVLKDEVVLFNPDSEIQKNICMLDTDRPDNRSNDAKVAPDGSLWVGTMDERQQEASGRLWRITADGERQMMLDDVGISNTLVWDTDRGIFYFADSEASSVFRFPYPDFKDVRPNAGYTGANAVFVKLEDNSVPDGSCIDSSGYLWNAQWDGSRVVRYSPDGGVDYVLSLPVQRPTSCCFGGANLKTLFITTASVGLSDKQLSQQSQAGNVLALDLDISGYPGERFRL